MRRLVTVLVLVLVAVPAGALAQEPRTNLPDIEDEVMCVSCKVPLNIAESAQADRQRALIKDLVDEGLTKEQVKDRLVAEYGRNVLAMPDDEGVGLAAYVVPIAVVVAFGALLAVLLPRWRRREMMPLPGSAVVASDEELKRLDEDLQRAG